MVMDRNPSTRRSFGCPDRHWVTLGEIVEAEDYESKSELLRELVAERVREFSDDQEADETHHLPGDDQRREVYRAALRASTEKLRVHERHYSVVAQETQVDAQAVESILHDLRRSGYVALMGHPPDQHSMSAVWRVKPPVVDPDEWTHRESVGREHKTTLDGFSAPESTCIGHHPGPDGDCLKCGATVEGAGDEETCEGCDTPLRPDDGDLCPSCELLRADGGQEE